MANRLWRHNVGQADLLLVKLAGRWCHFCRRDFGRRCCTFTLRGRANRTSFSSERVRRTIRNMFLSVISARKSYPNRNPLRAAGNLETALLTEAWKIKGKQSGGDTMELLYDVAFKDAVTELSVPRKHLEQLAKTRATLVVRYAINTNSGAADPFIRRRGECRVHWHPRSVLCRCRIFPSDR